MTDPVTMSKAELRELVAEAVEEGVQKAFLSLGVDISTPAAIVEAQKDFQHVRSWRKAKETVAKQGLTTTVGIIITGLLAAAYVKYGGGK